MEGKDLSTLTVLLQCSCTTIVFSEDATFTDKRASAISVVSRLLPLPCRLCLRLSWRWSTGVDGRALEGQVIASRLDTINRSPLNHCLLIRRVVKTYPKSPICI
ncbi:hypothetical protein UY3_05470 [Chelonia mydas]|uniref:Uncharacterized protein n=1 Tax=Chelonia mydas TaxID=8469 RepID=M7BNR2_CHEMY|nr:hypothetical protein UY3_05470 [Chelonia mydas]